MKNFWKVNQNLRNFLKNEKIKIKKMKKKITNNKRKLRLNLSESFLPLSEDKGIMKLLHLQSLVLFLSSTIV
jgi:hypothetical protein